MKECSLAQSYGHIMEADSTRRPYLLGIKEPLPKYVLSNDISSENQQLLITAQGGHYAALFSSSPTCN